MALVVLFLRRFPRDCVWLVLGTALATALQLTALLLLVYGAEKAYAGTTPYTAFGVVVGSLLAYAAVWLFTVARARRVAVESAKAIAHAVVGGVAVSDLERIECIGRRNMRDRVTQDLRVLPDAAVAILSALSVLVLTAAAGVYLALTAPIAVTVLLVTAAAVGWLHRRSRSATTSSEANPGAGGSHDAPIGPDDLRLGGDGTAALDPSAADEVESVVSTGDAFVDLWLLVSLGWIVLLLPTMGVVENVVGGVAVTFWLWAQLRAAPALLARARRGGDAAGRLVELETHLRAPDQPPAPAPVEGLHELRFEAVAYAYPGTNGRRPFELGPFDLSLVPGEVTFVIGLPGSGKSTLLKLLAGLYRPRVGTVLLNGRHASPATRRALVAAAFSGVPSEYARNEDDATGGEHLRALLRELGLGEPPFVFGERLFKLRAGVPLVAALASERPILLLDGWTAQMSPGTRDWFVRELLPALKRRGKAIVLGIDDGRLASHADRCLYLERGRPVRAEGVR